MVVVFRPRDVGGVARRQARRTPARTPPAAAALWCAASASSFACNAGSASVSWSGEAKPRPFRRVALDDFLPADAILRQIDRRRHRGQRGGGEEDRDADADLHLGVAFQPRDRRRGSRAQSLDQQEVAAAEREQHEEHRDLRADHHAIGGAVECRPSRRCRPGSWSAPLTSDAGDAGHRHAREPRADQCARPAPFVDPAECHAESRECRRSRSRRRTGAGTPPAAAACGHRAAPRHAWSASPPPARSRPARAAARPARADRVRTAVSAISAAAAVLTRPARRNCAAQHVARS